MTEANETFAQLHYLTPGVYQRPRRAEQRDIRRVRTDIAGFIGFTERGPLLSDSLEKAGLLPPTGQIDHAVQRLAVRLTSWNEFRVIFGGFIPFGCLAYAVRAFFENGGTTCYVVRVAATEDKNPDRRPRTATFALPSGLPSQRSEAIVLAKNPGGDDVDVFIADPKLPAEGELVGIEKNEKGTKSTEFGLVMNQKRGQIRFARPIGEFFAKSHAHLVIYSSALSVTAASSGNWGNRIRLMVTPLKTGAAVTEFALRVMLDPGLDRTLTVEEEFYRRLSFDPASQFYIPHVINGLSKLINIEVKASSLLIKEGPLAVEREPEKNRDQRDLRPKSVRLLGGQDGLNSVTLQDFTGGADDLRGLRLLEEIDEVSILCAPDVVCEQPAVLPKPPAPPRDPCLPPQKQPEPDPVAEDPTARPPTLKETEVVQVYRAMIEQCERLHDRVAILDTPLPLRSSDQLQKWREKFVTRFAAMYYPWLKVPDSLFLSGPTRHVPPSGHVSGIYARIDNQFGVHRPPANAPLKFVTDVVEEVTSLQQEHLNPFGINAIRAFAGRGIRVWGVRSLASKDDRDWQFIHVRRLMSMIEESVEDSMQWAVFEPNDEALRRTLVHSLSVFLEAIWRQAGLKGAVPAEGFYVKCDETNNPPPVVESGQVVCRVGVAVAAPMEFLVFEVRQQPNGAQIVEP